MLTAPGNEPAATSHKMVPETGRAVETMVREPTGLDPDSGGRRIVNPTQD